MLNDQLIEPELLSRALQHPLLDTTLGDEPEDEYLFGLTDAVGAIHCLEVGLWVPVHLSELDPQGKSVPSPVAVIKDDDVSGRQVDAQTTSAGGKEENKFVASLLVVFVNGQDTVLVGSTPVNSTVL